MVWYNNLLSLPFIGLLVLAFDEHKRLPSQGALQIRYIVPNFIAALRMHCCLLVWSSGKQNLHLPNVLTVGVFKSLLLGVGSSGLPYRSAHYGARLLMNKVAYFVLKPLLNM